MAYRIQWLQGNGDLTAAFAIRLEVFCDEQGYTPEIELDEQDRTAEHVVLWDGETPVATGRLYWNGEGVVRLGRIAVRKAWRGQGTGAQVVRAMCERAREWGAARVQLDAQCRAVPFYEKCGFAVCGEEHMDGHVPHREMERLL